MIIFSDIYSRIRTKNEFVTMVDLEELYRLTQENNAMLKEIAVSKTHKPTEKLFVHESIADKYTSNELKLF